MKPTSTVVTPLILTLILLCALSLQAQQVLRYQNSAQGINFLPLEWAGQEQTPFVNIMNQATPLYSRPKNGGTWEDKRPLDLGANGYPKSLLPDQNAAAFILIPDFVGKYEQDFVCLWEGSGQVIMDFQVRVTSTGTKRITFQPTERGRVRMQIIRTDPTDPVRNIRVLLPGTEATHQSAIWNPVFLEKISHFRTLRFMDWMKANSSFIETFADRTTPQFPTQTGEHGMCLEYMVGLCNLMNMDGWFCLPFAANDDYYRQAATYIRDHLNAHLKAHIEYGNEIWNGGVSEGAGWCQKQARAAGLSGSDWDLQLAWWAKRSTEMLRIVSEVYQGHENQVVRVVGTHIGNSKATETLLNKHGGKNYADAIAIARYINPKKGDWNKSQTISALVAALQRHANLTAQDIAGDVQRAKTYGKRLIAYEGGIDVFPATYNVNEELAKQVRFAPEIKAVYDTLYAQWKRAGGELFCNYTFADSIWGMLPNIWVDNQKGPAFMAALDFIKKNPPWWSEQREAVSVAPLRPFLSRAPQHPRGATALLLCQHSMIAPLAGQHLYSLDGRRVGGANRQPSATAPGLFILRQQNPGSRSW